MTIKFNAMTCSKRWQVDDHQSYGEVPGTAAYSMRTQDAVPDELEVIPERKKKNTRQAQSISTKPQAWTAYVSQRLCFSKST